MTCTITRAHRETKACYMDFYEIHLFKVITYDFYLSGLHPVACIDYTHCRRRNKCFQWFYFISLPLHVSVHIRCYASFFRIVNSHLKMVEWPKHVAEVE
jgi:hypothetical protein